MADKITFNYGDFVKIIKGFYKDCTGRLINYDWVTDNYEVEIIVYFSSYDKREKIIVVYKNEIELLEKLAEPKINQND